MDKLDGEPSFCCCRGTWRRRALADELVDDFGLLQRAAGARVWLGRRRPWQGLLWPAASGHGRPDGGAVEFQERLCGEGGVGACRLRVGKGQNEREWDAATRAHARAKRVLWARPAHARYVLDAMPGRARGLG